MVLIKLNCLLELNYDSVEFAVWISMCSLLYLETSQFASSSSSCVFVCVCLCVSGRGRPVVGAGAALYSGGRPDSQLWFRAVLHPPHGPLHPGPSGLRIYDAAECRRAAGLQVHACSLWERWALTDRPSNKHIIIISFWLQAAEVQLTVKSYRAWLCSEGINTHRLHVNLKISIDVGLNNYLNNNNCYV